MDDDLVRAAQLQSWRAWRCPEGRHCKLLCNLPPPEDERPTAAMDLEVNEAGVSNVCSESQGDPVRAEDNVETQRSRGESLWPPVLTVGTVVLLLYGAQELDKSSPGSGRHLLVVVFGILAVLGFVYTVLGKNVRETGKNAWSAVRSVMLFIALALAVGAAVQCVGINPDRGSADGMYDSWNRR